jgi:hypothetical protein
VSEWCPDPLYRQVSDEQLMDPLPQEPAMSMLSDEAVETHDDHDVTPVDPAWFLSFDEVDSRVIGSYGAPE